MMITTDMWDQFPSEIYKWLWAKPSVQPSS